MGVTRRQVRHPVRPLRLQKRVPRAALVRLSARAGHPPRHETLQRQAARSCSARLRRDGARSAHLRGLRSKPSSPTRATRSTTSSCARPRTRRATRRREEHRAPSAPPLRPPGSSSPQRRDATAAIRAAPIASPFVDSVVAHLCRRRSPSRRRRAPSRRPRCHRVECRPPRTPRSPG